jgi:hypothetical protein
MSLSLSMVTRPVATRFAAIALVGAMAGVTFAPADAEARWRRGHAGGAVAAGIIGGLALGALAAGAYSRPAYAGPRYHHVSEPECWVERRRVWDGYRWVRVRQTVCD